MSLYLALTYTRIWNAELRGPSRVDDCFVPYKNHVHPSLSSGGQNLLSFILL